MTLLKTRTPYLRHCKRLSCWMIDLSLILSGCKWPSSEIVKEYLLTTFSALVISSVVGVSKFYQEYLDQHYIMHAFNKPFIFHIWNMFFSVFHSSTSFLAALQRACGLQMGTSMGLKVSFTHCREYASSLLDLYTYWSSLPPGDVIGLSLAST